MNTSIEKRQTLNDSPYTVTLRTGIYTDEDGLTHVGYGVDVTTSPDEPPIFSAEDLSTDRGAVESLIRTMREADVSPTHFEDIVEDFLT